MPRHDCEIMYHTTYPNQPRSQASTLRNVGTWEQGYIAPSSNW